MGLGCHQIEDRHAAGRRNSPGEQIDRGTFLSFGLETDKGDPAASGEARQLLYGGLSLWRPMAQEEKACSAFVARRRAGCTPRARAGADSRGRRPSCEPRARTWKILCARWPYPAPHID